MTPSCCKSIPKSVKTSNRAVKQVENIWLGETATAACHANSISEKRNACQGRWLCRRSSGHRIGGAQVPLACKPVSAIRGDTVAEENGQLCVNHTPVLPSSGPLFRNIHHCQIQHLKKAVVGRKDGLRFGMVSDSTQTFLRINLDGIKVTTLDTDT